MQPLMNRFTRQSKPTVVGNWKMYGNQQQVRRWTAVIAAQATAEINWAVLPPAVYLQQIVTALVDTSVACGIQHINEHEAGAFTGEIAAVMAADLGCRYALIGHSERRLYYAETDESVATKCIAAVSAGLIPIICVGESQTGQTPEQAARVIYQQLVPLLNLAQSVALLGQSVVAYEPVWAIGSGLTASPDYAQSVQRLIRQHISELDQNVATELPILYGGSVKTSNAAALVEMPDIDGFLVGGASLDANEFLEIGQLCKQSF